MSIFLVEDGGTGGAVAHGPGYIPGPQGSLIHLNGRRDLGYDAVFLDSEGNRVAVHSME